MVRRSLFAVHQFCLRTGREPSRAPVRGLDCRRVVRRRRPRGARRESSAERDASRAAPALRHRHATGRRADARRGRGVRLQPQMGGRGSAGAGTPELRTSVSATGRAPRSRSLRCRSIYFEGRLVVFVEEARWAADGPLRHGGAGYLRQLHEGRTVVETVMLSRGRRPETLIARARPRRCERRGAARRFAAGRSRRRHYVRSSPDRHMAASGGFFVAF